MLTFKPGEHWVTVRGRRRVRRVLEVIDNPAFGPAVWVGYSCGGLTYVIRETSMRAWVRRRGAVKARLKIW